MENFAFEYIKDVLLTIGFIWAFLHVVLAIVVYRA